MSEIHRLLSISRPMVFAYRSGKNRITQKVWLALEDAERKVGIIDAGKSEEKPEIAESSAIPKDPDIGISAHVLREEPAIYHVNPKPELTTEQRLARLEGIMERVASALEELVDNQRRESK